MQIELTQGRVSVIDDVDADLAAFNWCVYRKRKGRRTCYAIRAIQKPDGQPTTEKLHRVVAQRMGIVGAPDHKDRDGLNNRRSNLRQATKGQNGANKDLSPRNTSGFKGVSWYGPSSKWRACITVSGRQRRLGLFTDPVEAAKVYDRAALEAWGEFAVLNFPTCRGSGRNSLSPSRS